MGISRIANSLDLTSSKKRIGEKNERFHSTFEI